MNEKLPITRRDALLRLGGLMLIGVLPMRGAPWRARKPFPHPDPRPGITAAHVLSVDELPKKKKAVLESYEIARTYPEILDGLYCPCECSESLHHRSLLACFESKQPTGCMGCQEAAEFVGPLAKKGKTLAEIRHAVDEKFGR